MNEPVTKQSVAYRWAGSTAPKRCGTCTMFVAGRSHSGSPHVVGTCHVAGEPLGDIHVIGLIEDNHVCADWEGQDDVRARTRSPAA